MKKIVALALCLVLALSLCATAFALNTAGLYNYTYATDSIGDQQLATLTYVKAVEAKTTADGHVAYYKDENNTNKYVVADQDDADFVMYTGTGYIYLATTTNVDYSVNPGYVLAYEAPTTNACGKYNLDVGYDAIFSKVNGAGDTEYFKAVEAAGAAGNNQINVLVDGTIYTITTTALTVDTFGHTWKALTTNATTGAVETVVCKACGAKGTVVSSAVYAAAPAAQKSNDFGTLKVLVAAAASTTTSAVSSAKTFDAGIALYVGMSISAVAGSAVVIGKKKEF